MWDIQLFELNYCSREARAAEQVISSGWLSMGEKVAQFEEGFSAFLSHEVVSKAVANGTAALHMALLALGVKPGDEVIIPALTFVADANVVRLVGAIPKLADCSSINDWNVSMETIKKQVTSKTKVIIVVHYAGYPLMDIKELSQFCKEQEIGLIEDVAHAPGATVNNKACGTFGDVGCFSFFSNKNLSIGEGGMVTTIRSDIAQKLGYLRSHGMSTLTLDRHKGRAFTYDVCQPGLNYRMDEMRAAIGLVQLDKLRASNERRLTLTERYRTNLSDKGVLIPFANHPVNAKSVYHILPIILPQTVCRKTVMGGLKQRGIQTSIHYPPFWSFTAYKDYFSATDAPIAAFICEHQLTLPLFPTMTEIQVDRVCDAIMEVLI